MAEMPETGEIAGRPAPALPASLTIVVPTFDRPGPLAGCLAAIERLERGATTLEVVVVDDGSTPPSRAVVERFASTLAPVYEHRPNAGVAAARNRGLALANGELVAFVADDQRLPPDYLSRVVGFFRDHPEAQVVSFNLRAAGPSRLRGVQSIYMQLALGQCYRVGGQASEVVASLTLPASRAAAFRRSVFDRVGRFDESLRVGEDGEMGRRLAAHGIPVHLFRHRYIDHYEDRHALGYLAQRIRYGRSFVRVLGGGPARATLERLSVLGIPVCAARKLREWRGVAADLGERRRFLAYWPALFGFLSLFYLGALLELRRPGAPAGSAR